MKITWGWDDGYANRRPDLELEVPDEDLEDLDEEGQAEVIMEYVREELDRVVFPWWRREPT